MKVHAESKVEGLEDQLRRLKAQLEETLRQNQDLNNLKARLTQENFELQRQVQELDASNAALSKAKAQLQAQLDETKARLDEETRVRITLCVLVLSCLQPSSIRRLAASWTTVLRPKFSVFSRL